MNESVLQAETLKKDVTKKDSPGVYIPPPLFYIGAFFISIFIQKKLPLPGFIAGTVFGNVTGYVCIGLWLCLFLLSMAKFITSKNTLVTVKPASTLQTTGIYSLTRNPMYLSLVMLYTGIAMFWGNWYTLFLLPLLILFVQLYIIRKEEKYLERAFGEQYKQYRSAVRRWI